MSKPVQAFEPKPKKEIRYDTDIFGQQTLPEARIEAQRLASPKVRIVRATLPFFVVPDGERCPCCGGTIKLEFK